MGRVGGEQAKGMKIPFDDLAIEAAALGQGYAVAPLISDDSELKK